MSALSPVSSTGSSPSRRSWATAAALVGLTLSAIDEMGEHLARPAELDDGVPPVSSTTHGGATDLVPLARRPCRPPPSPARLAKSSTAGSVPHLGPGSAGDGARDRVLTGGFERTGDPQHLGAIDVGAWIDVDQRHHAGRDGAGLVEHDRVDLTGRLEHLGTLDQQPELGAAPGADEQGCGRGEAERARAGDDQHRRRRR